MRRAIAAAVILIGFAAPALGSYADGMAAYQRSDFAKALREILPLAKQDLAAAQYLLGHMYYNGQGVVANPNKAIRWYRKAAAQGDADAQQSLGFIFASGKGRPRNYAEAARWWRKAAEKRHSQAQYNLGILYQNGWSVAKDDAQAVWWWRKAAEQGHARAEYKLGLMYGAGRGVQQDYAESARWYRKAAEQRVAEAQYALGRSYSNGRGVPRDDVQAHRWFGIAAASAASGEDRGRAIASRDEIAQRLTPDQLAEAKRLALSKQPDQPAATSRPGAKDPAPIRDRIAGIQRGLASLGYETGPANGILGSTTRAALRAFKAREGLSGTAIISERLEAALRSAIRAKARPAPPAPSVLKKDSTGSGFFVSPEGHVLTNKHLVEGCREVRVAKLGTARHVTMDSKVDLAMFKVKPSGRELAVFRSGRGVRTGVDVVVAGYPLQGLLSSEMNVTKGSVSALAGPGDDRRIFQITAPVQPGNSGGPVLDASGHVVGVVVARLDELKMARLTGSLPQNVNFAISEGAARAFLDAHDVPYTTAKSNRTMPTADIAAKAKGYTVLIECWK